MGHSTLPISHLAAVSLTKSVKSLPPRATSKVNSLSLLQGPSDKFAMSLKALTDDEKTELKDQFTVLDKSESGFINLSELKEALDLAGFKVPGWRVSVKMIFLRFIINIFLLKVRDMIDKIDRDTAAENNIVGQRKLSFGEFEHVRLINSSISNTKGTKLKLIIFSFVVSSSQRRCPSHSSEWSRKRTTSRPTEECPRPAP